MVAIILNAANTSADSGNAFMFYKNSFWSNLTKKNWRTFDFLLSRLRCISFTAKYSLVFAVPKSIHKWSNSFSTHKQCFRILLCQLLVISGDLCKLDLCKLLIKNVKYDLAVLLATKYHIQILSRRSDRTFYQFLLIKTWKTHLCSYRLRRIAASLRMFLVLLSFYFIKCNLRGLT